MATRYTNSIVSYGSDNEVTDVFTSEEVPLGTYREEDGVGYVFVKLNAGATAAVAGRFAWATGTAFTVTATIDEGTRGAVGEFVSVIPTSGYGWVKVKGSVFGTI